MSGADSAKVLLSKYNEKHYLAYILGPDTKSLSLRAVSSVPGVGASRRPDIYKKTLSNPHSSHHIKFITKNDEPHSFLWQTSAETLKKAARWGIVKTHSITGNVIGKLGQYRVAAHKRVVKGMISNSQTLKLKLLDLFQDRFEALQDLESLVNKKNTLITYKETLKNYIKKLETIKSGLNDYFSNVNHVGLDDITLRQITQDIDADIARAKAYAAGLNADNLQRYNRARGPHSVLDFVKEQMIYGLYELQGINQDITFSRQRYFALTRGELNDFIEDARKEIDDHEADLCNAVTEKHHGLYSANKEDLMAYDFADDQLTPARERDVLLAISFIEGWDKVQKDEHGAFTISNGTHEEMLDTITATRWRTHRNVIALLQSIGFYIFNIIKGVFISTKPWEEETWKNPDFHLTAASLRVKARPNEPLWRKPFKFLKQTCYALMDVFNGVYDFGAELAIGMPSDIVSDWESSKEIDTLEETLRQASSAMQTIHLIEASRLQNVLMHCDDGPSVSPIVDASVKLARVEYALTGSDQNDILNAIARGLNGFGSFFAHHIYAKDPVGGLCFTAAYAVGAGAIYLPALTSSVFSAQYVNWFSNFAYSMGSSPLAAVVAGGSTQGQVFATIWDGMMHGPSGMAMNAIYQCGEDPLTIGAYFAAAYGLGYLLANGINGYPIPWLSEHLKADLGTAPEAGYPLVGAKIAIMLYEGLLTEGKEPGVCPAFSVSGRELNKLMLPVESKEIVEKFCLVFWLSQNAEALPKLSPKLRLALSRHIERVFKDDAKSLNKLLYPEVPTSIAFQVVSIPLSYIPAILRFTISIFLSFAAAIGGGKHPMDPLKRASIDLMEKVKKDGSRLLVFATHVTYITYMMITTFVKMLAFLAIIAVGRIGGLFNAKPAHDMHQGVASVHAFFRRLGEFFYPARALNKVISAHPTHTMQNVESSYKLLLSNLGHREPTRGEPVNPSHALPVFPVPPTTAVVIPPCPAALPQLA